jgi:hypothetical protein
MLSPARTPERTPLLFLIVSLASVSGFFTTCVIFEFIAIHPFVR